MTLMSTEESQEEEHYNIFFQVNNTWNGLRSYIFSFRKIIWLFILSLAWLSTWLIFYSEDLSSTVIEGKTSLWKYASRSAIFIIYHHPFNRVVLKDFSPILIGIFAVNVFVLVVEKVGFCTICLSFDCIFY